jgi:hypothetical protein
MIIIQTKDKRFGNTKSTIMPVRMQDIRYNQDVIF